MSKKITPAFKIHTDSSNRAGSEKTGTMYVSLTRIFEHRWRVERLRVSIR